MTAVLCNRINYYVVQSLALVLPLSSYEIPLPPILHHMSQAHTYMQHCSLQTLYRTPDTMNIHPLPWNVDFIFISSACTDCHIPCPPHVPLHTPLCCHYTYAPSFSRYNTDAYAVEFLSDGSNETFWRSASNVSPVTVQLHLRSEINLSKIFITFESALPPSAKLEYFNESSLWDPLQYWADDCTERFELDNNGM